MKLVMVFGLVAGSCAWLLEPVPPGEYWTPPAHYRAIWDSAQACTGRTGDFDRLEWRRMPGNSFPYKDGAAIGQWTPPHSITIAVEWTTTNWVIKHEMIHDLLQEGHSKRELAKIWGERCRATWGYQPIDSTYRP